MHYFNLIGFLALKDLRIEYRSKQAFLTTVFFALLILTVFNFAFDPGSRMAHEVAPGILWVTLLFPGILQLNRSFQIESEEGTLYGVILSPVDRGLVFLGKFVANWCSLMVVDCLILVAFTFFFNFTFSPHFFWVLLLIILASAGFTAVGTLFAAMVNRIRTREVLLPILLFPVVVPVLFAAIKGTQAILLQQQLFLFDYWLRLLIVFDVIFLTVCFLLFEYVIADG